MPRNGSGGFSLVSGNPVVTGTTISSTDFNNTMTDVGTALAGSLAADGQTAWAGNQNANGNRLTALPLPAASTDAGTAGDMQNGRLTYLTGVAGTNSLTASVALMAAYTAGQTFRFVAANSNTTAVTLNINSLGALSISKLGNVPLAAGDIRAGQMVTVAHDGTKFQLLTAAAGVLIGVQVIGATSTYTPSAGTNSVVVEVFGGGGAGGGTPATTAGQIAAGSGGSAGGYAKSRLTSGFAGVTATIGAGGTGSVGLAGGNGGTTSFGALLSATGGTGGTAGTAVAAGASISFVLSGAGGAPSSGNIVNSTGQQGLPALYTTNFAMSGAGAAGHLGGGGGAGISSGAANNAGAINAGGGGAASFNVTAAAAGGIGGAGQCLVWEYA